MILPTQEHPLEDYAGKSAIFNPCSSEVIKGVTLHIQWAKNWLLSWQFTGVAIGALLVCTSASCRKESATEPDLLYCFSSSAL